MGRRNRQAPAGSPPAREPARFATLAELGGLKKALAEEARRREAERLAQRLHEERLAREASVFRREMADVAPLPPTNRVVQPPVPVSPVARQRELDEREALAQSLSDEIDIAQLLETDDRLSFRRAGVGTDALRKLRCGHWVVQARLDLHGLRRDDAREAVAGFVAQSARDGLRCVRVIHGKGLGSVNRQPVLKEKVMRWLAQREEVIAFCQAPPFAGGSGALLVLLRSPVAAPGAHQAMAR